MYDDRRLERLLLHGGDFRGWMDVVRDKFGIYIPELMEPAHDARRSYPSDWFVFKRAMNIWDRDSYILHGNGLTEDGHCWYLATGVGIRAKPMCFHPWRLRYPEELLRLYQFSYAHASGHAHDRVRAVFKQFSRLRVKTVYLPVGEHGDGRNDGYGKKVSTYRDSTFKEPHFDIGWYKPEELIKSANPLEALGEIPPAFTKRQLALAREAIRVVEYRDAWWSFAHSIRAMLDFAVANRLGRPDPYSAYRGLEYRARVDFGGITGHWKYAGASWELDFLEPEYHYSIDGKGVSTCLRRPDEP